MEIYEARVKQDGDNCHLELDCKGKVLQITLTEERPNDIKDVFNELIIQLKRQQFNFELKDPGSDLFSQIAIEYINHLNGELTGIHGELVANGLIIEEQGPVKQKTPQAATTRK